MRITDDYSSWCRNLLTTSDRVRIVNAGPGEVRFSRPGRKWCAKVTVKDGRTAVGFDAKLPGVAFDNALKAVAQ